VLAPVFLPTGVEQRRYSHPNAPEIDPDSRAVRGRSFTSTASIRPLAAVDHAPVRVEVHETASPSFKAAPKPESFRAPGRFGRAAVEGRGAARLVGARLGVLRAAVPRPGTAATRTLDQAGWWT